MPLNVTETFESDVDNGTESACASAPARLSPKMETIEPGATGTPPAKLAPFTMPPSVTDGIWATAEQTDANRQNTNCSVFILIPRETILNHLDLPGIPRGTNNFG